MASWQPWLRPGRAVRAQGGAAAQLTSGARGAAGWVRSSQVLQTLPGQCSPAPRASEALLGRTGDWPNGRGRDGCCRSRASPGGEQGPPARLGHPAGSGAERSGLSCGAALPSSRLPPQSASSASLCPAASRRGERQRKRFRARKCWPWRSLSLRGQGRHRGAAPSAALFSLLSLGVCLRLRRYFPSPPFLWLNNEWDVSLKNLFRCGFSKCTAELCCRK